MHQHGSMCVNSEMRRDVGELDREGAFKLK